MAGTRKPARKSVAPTQKIPARMCTRRISAMSVPNMRSTIHRQGVDRSTLFSCHLPSRGSGIALHLLRLGRTSNDRSNDGTRQQPADRKLQQRVPPGLGEVHELFDDREILLR